MTLSKPIPKALLPHTAILKTPRPESIFADGVYDELKLFNVRIELKERFKQSKSGEARTRGARMYFDCVNSSPHGVEFKPEQSVIFCGDIFKIDEVRAVMAAQKVHHYRIEMI
jgi:hypothetical protein